jgi:alcohol dehydrogenase class IV
VITDGAAGCKRTLLSAALLPRAVIADPETTAALPSHLTAATGMDALTHALEAWFSPGYNPIADGVALEATRLIATWLPVACAEPDHAEARTHMLMAAGMAAVAFSKGLGLVHAMVHPLGAVTDIHHGLANGVLLPYVLRFNRPAIEERAAPLARHLALDEGGGAFEAVLDWVLALRREVGIPATLADAGVGDVALAGALAPGAMAETLYLSTNPRPVTEADVRGLYREALGG